MDKQISVNVPHYDYDCKHCGPYVITRPAKAACERAPIVRWKAACVSTERHLKLPIKYRIHTKPIDDDDLSDLPTVTLMSLFDEYPRSPLALLDRALLNLSRMVGHPGRKITLSVDHPAVLFSETGEELLYVVHQFYKLGYIGLNTDVPDQVVHSPGDHPVAGYLIEKGFYIQAKGWQRLGELKHTSVGGEPQGFVAMWFSTETEDFYDNGIKPAIEADCNCKCLRIDEKAHINKICDEIVAAIRRSTFVVADFTAGCCTMCATCKHETDCKVKVRPRGGVYFEAGFALGLGIPVIWTVQKDQIDCVHFDTRQYNHITYTDAKDLRKQLANRIQANIPLGQLDAE